MAARISTIFALALLAAGCVISKEPVLGPETRVVPFASGTRFQIYERETTKAAWKPDKEIAFLVGADKVVRETDAAGNPVVGESYTFHSIGPDRYLVHADFGAGRHAYGLLEIRGSQGFVTAFQCRSIGADLLERAGVKRMGEDCLLDGITDPARLLKQLAARPDPALIKYVPVKKK
jgi:hypothetical protein